MLAYFQQMRKVSCAQRDQVVCKRRSKLVQLEDAPTSVFNSVFPRRVPETFYWRVLHKGTFSGAAETCGPL